MTAPAPPDVQMVCDDLAKRLKRLADTYRWLYPAVYERRRGGDQPAAQLCSRCDGTGHLDGQPCEWCTHAPADPVGELVANRDEMRSKLETAGRLLRQAHAMAKGAGKALDDLAGYGTNDGMLDRGRDRTIPPATSLYLRDSKRNERDGKAAQRRRLDRGEGWGAA